MSTLPTHRTPYTYLIGWSHLNIWYYGRRTAKHCSPAELWVKYFTSSQPVAAFRKKYGEPDIIKIRKIFNTVSQCILWETRFLSKVNAKHNIMFLNKSNGDNKWDTTGQTGFCAAKEIETGKKLGRISLTDTRWESGEIAGLTRGRKQSIEERTNRSLQMKGRPSLRKGKTGVACSDETKEKLRKINQGKTMRAETKEKISNSHKGKQLSEATKEKMRKPKSETAIAKSRQIWEERSNRDIVFKCRELAKYHNVPLGKGWTRRSDEWILDKIKEFSTI